MAAPAPLRRTARRLERVVLGAAMSVAAWVIERRLLKAIRDGGGRAPQPAASAVRLTVADTPAPDDAG
jgi:hypothetical protein